MLIYEKKYRKSLNNLYKQLIYIIKLLKEKNINMN